MLRPTIFDDSFFDDFFGVPNRNSYREERRTAPLMQTDIEEQNNGYMLTMNIPGFKKEDVKAELKDGTLTITAESSTSDDKKDEKGKYIRRERFYGSCSRSFYVGKDVKQEDIKAKFEDGTLKLYVPKKEAIPEKETSKYITIEG